MVAFHHLCSQGTFGGWPRLAATLKHGSFGVQIFFVLSGFLITWLLLREEHRSGTIDLKRFYFRRSLRIFPPAFFFLGAMGVLTVLGLVSIGGRDFLFSFLFIRNAYGAGGSPEVAHFWSLAVEEQFYLTWPFFMLVLRGRTRLLATTMLIAVLALWRAAGILHFGVTAAGAESLLVGCLLAQLRDVRPDWLSMSAPRARTALVTVAAAAVSLVAFAGVARLEESGLAQTAAVLAVAVIVSIVAAGNVPGISPVLALAPVEWIGRLSYSLYLWQQVFCWSSISGRYAATHWPVLVIASFLTAAFSYYVVEQPALALRQQLELRWFPRPNSVGHPAAMPTALAPLA
jgi:peptidoglycan/LPS O-acetylase OafA/YrhL